MKYLVIVDKKKSGSGKLPDPYLPVACQSAKEKLATKRPPPAEPCY